MSVLPNVAAGEGVRCIHPEAVRAARAGIPGAASLLRLAASFDLLGDPARLRLLLALHAVGAVGDGQQMCVCDLAAATGASESATSHSLRLLRAHGVVRVRRAGRMAYYSLADGTVEAVLDLALAHLAEDNADR